MSGAAYLALLKWMLTTLGLALLLIQPLHAHAEIDGRVVARDFKMAGDATRVRMVFNTDTEVAPRWLLLRAPYRLVIDMPETLMLFEPETLSARGLVRSVRYGALDPKTTRLVLSTKGPFSVEKIDVMKDDAAAGYRVVADISAASERDFQAALADQAVTTASTGKGDRAAAPPARNKRYTIVVDAGHGGIDGGAKGLNGTVEKDITLAFARELRDKLASSGMYDVFMTRDSDEFIRLDDRVRIARQDGADLFISIHADTINVKDLRGATIYTVSDKASDAEAAALADRENLADALAGVDVKQEDHEVADILIDLIRRETHAFSIEFARALVGELSSSVGLIKNPHRAAGFRVLKAPDIPSVLIELGYLSNERDEALLRSVEWRDKAVTSISDAVDKYARSRVASVR